MVKRCDGPCFPSSAPNPPPRPAAAAAALQALGALRNLAFDAENAAEAVREGGIQAMTDTLHCACCLQ